MSFDWIKNSNQIGAYVNSNVRGIVANRTHTFVAIENKHETSDEEEKALRVLKIDGLGRLIDAVQIDYEVMDYIQFAGIRLDGNQLYIGYMTNNGTSTDREPNLSIYSTDVKFSSYEIITYSSPGDVDSTYKSNFRLFVKDAVIYTALVYENSGSSGSGATLVVTKGADEYSLDLSSIFGTDVTTMLLSSQTNPDIFEQNRPCGDIFIDEDGSFFVLLKVRESSGDEDYQLYLVKLTSAGAFSSYSLKIGTSVRNSTFDYVVISGDVFGDMFIGYNSPTVEGQTIVAKIDRSDSDTLWTYTESSTYNSDDDWYETEKAIAVSYERTLYLTCLNTSAGGGDVVTNIYSYSAESDTGASKRQIFDTSDYRPGGASSGTNDDSFLVVNEERIFSVMRFDSVATGRSELRLVRYNLDFFDTEVKRLFTERRQYIEDISAPNFAIERLANKIRTNYLVNYPGEGKRLYVDLRLIAMMTYATTGVVTPDLGTLDAFDLLYINVLTNKKYYLKLYEKLKQSYQLIAQGRVINFLIKLPFGDAIMEKRYYGQDLVTLYDEALGQ